MTDSNPFDYLEPLRKNLDERERTITEIIRLKPDSITDPAFQTLLQDSREYRNLYLEASRHTQDDLRERQLEQYKARNRAREELGRSAVAYGQATLKSALLINGGGAVALLAYIGKVLPMRGMLALPLSFFGIGVFAAAFGTGLSYLTQYAYALKWKRAPFLHWVTAGVVVLSYFLFLAGVWQAYSVFDS